jgi:hypothetical protein
MHKSKKGRQWRLMLMDECGLHLDKGKTGGGTSWISLTWTHITDIYSFSWFHPKPKWWIWQSAVIRAIQPQTYTNLYRYNNFNMAAHHILAAPLGHFGSGSRGQCSSSLIFLLLLSFFLSFRCLFLLVTGQAIDSPYVFIVLTIIYHGWLLYH